MSEWLVLAIAMAAACAVVLIATLLLQRRRHDAEETGVEPAETPTSSST